MRSSEYEILVKRFTITNKFIFFALLKLKNIFDVIIGRFRHISNHNRLASLLSSFNVTYLFKYDFFSYVIHML